MADASLNNPKKEVLFALVGIVAFLGIVLLIGVSAFLRPAGEHVEPEVVVEADAELTDAEVTEQVTADNAEAVATPDDTLQTVEVADDTVAQVIDADNTAGADATEVASVAAANDTYADDVTAEEVVALPDAVVEQVAQGDVAGEAVVEDTTN